jgi:hypothetical protein
LSTSRVLRTLEMGFQLPPMPLTFDTAILFSSTRMSQILACSMLDEIFEDASASSALRVFPSLRQDELISSSCLSLLTTSDCKFEEWD